MLFEHTGMLFVDVENYIDGGDLSTDLDKELQAWEHTVIAEHRGEEGHSGIHKQALKSRAAIRLCLAAMARTDQDISKDRSFDDLEKRRGRDSRGGGCGHPTERV